MALKKYYDNVNNHFRHRDDVLDSHFFYHHPLFRVRAQSFNRTFDLFRKIIIISWELNENPEVFAVS